MKQLNSQQKQSIKVLKKRRSRLKNQLRIGTFITFCILLLGPAISYMLNRDGIVKQTKDETVTIYIDEVKNYAINAKSQDTSGMVTFFEKKYVPIDKLNDSGYKTLLVVAYPWAKMETEYQREFVVYLFDEQNSEEAKKALTNPLVVENTDIFTRKNSYKELSDSPSEAELAIKDLYVTITFTEVDYSDFIMVKESESDNRDDIEEWTKMVAITALIIDVFALGLFSYLKKLKFARSYFEKQAIKNELKEIKKNIKLICK